MATSTFQSELDRSVLRAYHEAVHRLAAWADAQGPASPEAQQHGHGQAHEHTLDAIASYLVSIDARLAALEAAARRSGPAELSAEPTPPSWGTQAAAPRAPRAASGTGSSRTSSEDATVDGRLRALRML